MQIHSPSPLHPARKLDRLGDEIAELSAHLDAATARLLELIRAFDARGGWNTGFRSCAAWLSWRVGLDLGAARERVRVARALGTLPLLAEALARGELSYAKVRALTRVATPETEARLLAVGRAGTAAHVERIVRGWPTRSSQATRSWKGVLTFPRNPACGCRHSPSSLKLVCFARERARRRSRYWWRESPTRNLTRGVARYPIVSTRPMRRDHASGNSSPINALLSPEKRAPWIS